MVFNTMKARVSLHNSRIMLCFYTMKIRVSLNTTWDIVSLQNHICYDVLQVVLTTWDIVSLHNHVCYDVLQVVLHHIS